MPLLIPGTTHLAAAANVRHRIKHTTIKHADARHRESRIRTDLIRAITGNEHRRITSRHVTTPHQGNGNTLAIAGGNPHSALHIFARLKSTKHSGTLQQAILAGCRIDIMQLAGTRVTGERVAYTGRIIRRITSQTDRIQAPGLPRHRIGGRTIRRSHGLAGNPMHGRSFALRSGQLVERTPHFGTLHVDLVHRLVNIPITFQRVRNQLGEPPWATCKKILRGRILRHHRDMRQTFRTVLQRHVMPMNRNSLDAKTMRPLQNGGIARIRIRRADRHRRSARFDIITMLTSVRRANSHTHTLAQTVWRLMRTHVNHIDFEIRVQRIVVDHGKRNVLAALAGTFETAEAHVVLHIRLARNERTEFTFRIVGGKQQHFGGGFRSGADHQIAFVERQADAHPESFVLFAIHLHIVGDGGANAVTHHRIWTPCVVEQHIEHPLCVRCEAGAADAFEHFRQFIAGFDVANTEIVTFVAADISAVQHPTSVFGNIHAADAEEIVALCFGVCVEHHLFAVDGNANLNGRRIPIVCASDRHTALHRILLAFLGACEIPVAVHARRHGHVGFLHVRFEFVEQCGT